MRDWWLRLGCFLTGYKYELIRHCSIGSEKAVHKYCSAILVVCLIWAFIGYSFAHRYLNANYVVSTIVALILTFVVIQIERQIILTVGKNKYIIWFRGSLAVIMALIGSVIIDQIIFKEDIEKNKLGTILTQVNLLLPTKAQELNSQIDFIDSTILKKEEERLKYISEITKNPTVPTYKSSLSYKPDSSGAIKLDNKNVETGYIQNPKVSLITQTDNQISVLNMQKLDKENQKLHIQEVLTNEISRKNGFIDELKILFGIIFSSVISVIMWLLLWLFFFSLEMLVLLSKVYDSRSDYEQIVLHQMNIRIEQLKALNQK